MSTPPASPSRPLPETARLCGMALRLVWHASPRLTVVIVALLTLQAALAPLQLILARVLLDRTAHDMGVTTGHDALALLWPLPVWFALVAATVVVSQLVQPVALTVRSLVGDHLTAYVTEQIIRAANRWQGLARFEDPAFADDLPRARGQAARSGLDLLMFGAGTALLLVSACGLALALLALHPLIPVLFLLAAVPQMTRQWTYTQQTGGHVYDYTAQGRRLAYAREVLLTPEPAKDVRLYDLGPYFRNQYDALFARTVGTVTALRRRLVIPLVLASVLAAGAPGAVYVYIVWHDRQGARPGRPRPRLSTPGPGPEPPLFTVVQPRGRGHAEGAGPSDEREAMMPRRSRLARRSRLRLLGLPALLALLLLSHATAALAHPMGNFSINLYSRLDVGATAIAMTYIVDLAEIPTYQEFGGARPDAHVQQEYLRRTVATLRGGLRLLVDGRRQEPRLTAQTIGFPPGQGGLALTRIELRFTAALAKLAAGSRHDISYTDTNYPGRLGWHEIVARPASGASLIRSDVSASDTTHELRVYPQDMLASPLDVRAAHLRSGPGAGVRALPAHVGVAGAARPADPLTAVITAGSFSPLALALALLAALGLGALHALSPGHGKTIVGAYLIGSRGTARHALFLGLTVTVTHTLGVFALGLITLYAARFIRPEQLYPWLGILSGALVVVMGLTLFRQRLRAGRSHHGHVHTPDHEHHEHHEHPHTPDQHDHGHVHGPHTHTHVPLGTDGAPLGWRSMLALGISGGLIPCPTALVVMLSAIALQRVGLGLLLIVMFSLGLASVLTAVGLLFVYGGRLLHRLDGSRLRRFGRGLRFLPAGSALLVTIAGLLITLQAVKAAGLL